MYILTDMSEELSNDFKLQQKRNPMCFGCGCQIYDQYILKVAPDLEWHATCLKCHECGQYLDENCTCFVRNGKTYCRHDYLRLFSRRCSKCKECFNKNDFVMKTNNRIFHIDCFRCIICNKQLAPGDEYLIKDDDLFCKLDSEMVIDSINKQNQYPLNTNINTSNTCQNITNMHSSNSNNKMIVKCDDNNQQNDVFNENQNSSLSPRQQQQQQNIHHSLQMNINSNPLNHYQIATTNTTVPIAYNHNLNQLHQNQPATSIPSQTQQNHILSHNSNNSSTRNPSNSSNNHHIHRKDKTTRVRTVLNEKQLHTLRACYGANPRPDALMKEQLVEMTGLSPRVIRVWFQNKRCKDKKKSIMIKQMQEQQKNRQSIGHGIPMVATSPVQNDLNNPNQVDIQTTSNIYQNNNLTWKNEYNMSPDINNLMNNRLNTNSNLSINNLHNKSSYDDMMNFASDEEDCFDNLSDQGNEDSVSSVGIDETRIQQL